MATMIDYIYVLYSTNTLNTNTIYIILKVIVT